MDMKEYISSGIIELYVLGSLSPQEMKEVEEMAAAHRSVAEEILQMQESLNNYAASHSQNPRSSLREEILRAVAASEKEERVISFPPRVSGNLSPAYWLKYLADNNIFSPPDFDMVHLVDFPGDEKQVTYAAWAKKGAVVEESHSDADEYLLMLKGHCSVTIDGKIGYYKEGDLVYVPKGCVHRAEALSDETMVLIGQRIAA